MIDYSVMNGKVKNKACKRTALLDAALELFTERGFSGSTTALIAKQAGVATGTLFVYFKTKDDLIHELFAEVSEAIMNKIQENIAPDMPVQDQFFEVFSQLLLYFLENPKVFKFAEQYHFSPLADRESDPPRETSPVRPLLLRARDEKIIKDLPLLVLESVVFGPIVSIAKEHSSQGTPISGEMIQQVVQACWDGIKR